MDNDWRDIPGYNGMYQISRMGEVRSWRGRGGQRLENPRPVSVHEGGRKTNVRRVHLRRPDGTFKTATLLGLMAKTWFGGTPPGMLPYHKNGDLGDHCLNNISFLTKSELGRITGGKGSRKPVAKVDRNGQIVEVYSSMTAAAKANYISRESVARRCYKRVSDPYSLDGFNYLFDE